jgi:mRNA interferase RelE/StbE
VNWVYRFDERALTELKRLDRQTQARIISFLDERVSGKENPRRLGKALRGPFSGLWRYRVGDYRLVTRIQDNELTVLVVRVGHRRNIYD